MTEVNGCKIYVCIVFIIRNLYVKNVPCTDLGDTVMRRTLSDLCSPYTHTTLNCWILIYALLWLLYIHIHLAEEAVIHKFVPLTQSHNHLHYHRSFTAHAILSLGRSSSTQALLRHLIIIAYYHRQMRRTSIKFSIRIIVCFHNSISRRILFTFTQSTRFHTILYRLLIRIWKGLPTDAHLTDVRVVGLENYIFTFGLRFTSNPFWNGATFFLLERIEQKNYLLLLWNWVE